LPSSTTGRIPRRTPPRRPVRRRPFSWKTRLASAAISVLLGILAWAAIARALAPRSNTSLTRFEAIIVLGSPADSDGNPAPEQLARVTEAVHEYKKGLAPRLILTGGAAYNHFVEAQVMARSAEAQGIPASAIYIEPNALNTIQNACYAVRIMKQHEWHSAEIVSADTHLPRAGLIFSALPLGDWQLEWSEHAAPPLAPESAAHHSALTAVEVIKTARYLTWARWMDRCDP
jgi:uncharacterized SAM-binding protein YcdF (DUF218 family)